MWLLGKYSLDCGELTLEGECTIRENNDYKFALMSNMPNEQLDDICELLLKFGKDAINHLNGRYTLMIYEKKTQDVYCIQDFLCGLTPVYFTTEKREVFVSTSLKKLLLASGKKRKMNMKARRTFEIRNAIYGKDTLIKDVFKLEPQRMLYISSNGVGIKVHKYVAQPYKHSDNLSVDECEKIWGESITNAVAFCASKKLEIAMPLSSGFDSNCILWNLSKLGYQVNCYCVGGSKGVNEIAAANEISQQYSSTAFYGTEVNENTFQSLPDIVWRLEGSVYEQGVFLQYELAKAVAQNGETVILCGEGSDEIFAHGFYEGLIKSDDKTSVVKKRRGNMYTWLVQYIGRKSTLIMNSFGIIPRYPYSDQRVLELAKYVKDVSNTRGKAFHKAYCRKIFPAEVMCLINSVGGKTDLTSLFHTDPYIELKELKKKEKFRFSLMLKLLDSYEINRMRIVNLIKGKRYDITKEYRQRFTNNVIIQLYLEVFSDIYISGKYDKYFDEPSFGITLDSLLEKKV